MLEYMTVSSNREIESLSELVLDDCETCLVLYEPSSRIRQLPGVCEVFIVGVTKELIELRNSDAHK